MNAGEATQVYGRAGVFGAVGGGLLGPVLLPVLVPSTHGPGRWASLGAVCFFGAWAIVAGLIVGGVVRGINGLVLSHRESRRRRGPLDQQVSRVVTSVYVVVALLAFLAAAQPQVMASLAGLCFIGAWAGAAGLIVGGAVGGVNGLVLSQRESGQRRSPLDQRVTAFVTSGGVVVACTWFLAAAGPVWARDIAIIALTGGVAGAVLAPTVVRGG